MRSIPPLFISAALAIAPCAALAEPCKEPGLEAVATEHPECRYYAGTRLYRERDYVGARLNWEYVLASEDDDKDVQKLRTDVRNNLGYLLYMGMGIKVNRTKAIELWETAARSGQEESAYHLCHALGDAKQPEYRPRAALPHCREALRRYQGLPIAKRDSNTEVIIQDLKRYIARLGDT
ncbi:SEL1-like repeat protein [Aquabacterium humicola]|uniref:SEL1-like repeat protein n=1 Tax=Aquabacterium humicola TaxID=3237377 RepID=UPI002542ACCA|nr:SEL1-like repeat protein [Rubrivivax pictus]